MKGPLVTTPVRRVAAALALGAALVTAGCGTTEAGRAATVDGRVITENEVQVAQAQINKTFPGANLTGDQVLGRLIGAPVYLDEIAQQGAPVSESLARTAYQQQDTYDGEAPADETLEVLRAQLAIQQLAQSGASVPTEALTKLKVDVNPRYGAFDASKLTEWDAVQSTAGLATSTPDWIKTVTTPQQ